MPADIAQTQNGGAVGDNRAQIVAAGELIAHLGVLLNLQTGLSHTGGVGQGQSVLAVCGHGGHDFNLALPLFVKAEGFLCIVHNSYS